MLVEMAVIETASEYTPATLSTHIVCRWGFPSRFAGKQTGRYGSSYFLTGAGTLLRASSPLNDALIPAVALRARTLAAIKQPELLFYDCQFNLRCYFLSGATPLCAYGASLYPSKSFHPHFYLYFGAASPAADPSVHGQCLVERPFWQPLPAYHRAFYPCTGRSPIWRGP